MELKPIYSILDAPSNAEKNRHTKNRLHGKILKYLSTGLISTIRFRILTRTIKLFFKRSGYAL